MCIIIISDIGTVVENVPASRYGMLALRSHLSDT